MGKDCHYTFPSMSFIFERRDLKMDHATLVASRFTVALFLSLVLGVIATSGNAQQPATSGSEDRDHGIQLYKQCDNKRPPAALRPPPQHHTKNPAPCTY